MSPGDFEKQADFIVEQQAQFASKLGQLEDIVARLATATLGRFEATDKRLDEIDERMAVLVESQIQTDESLRNLIAVVDRYFREGRNGAEGN